MINPCNAGKLAVFYARFSLLKRYEDTKSAPLPVDVQLEIDFYESLDKTVISKSEFGDIIELFVRVKSSYPSDFELEDLIPDSIIENDKEVYPKHKVISALKKCYQFLYQKNFEAGFGGV